VISFNTKDSSDFMVELHHVICSHFVYLHHLCVGVFLKKKKVLNKNYKINKIKNFKVCLFLSFFNLFIYFLLKSHFLKYKIKLDSYISF